MDRVEAGIVWVHAFYGRLLEWALMHRIAVLAIALVTFLASFLIVPLIGTEFIPEADQGFLSLRLNTPVGSSLEYTDNKVRQVEATLKAHFDDIRGCYHRAGKAQRYMQGLIFPSRP
jgi:multidrug efflux pump subunit AcrB